MKRSVRPRKVGPGSWLIGMLVVGGGLLGLFSLGRAAWLRQLPGIPVDPAEWSFFARLFDRHPVATTVPTLPVLAFGNSNEVSECLHAQRGGAWRSRWFEGDGKSDSVEVRHQLDRMGYVVRFHKEGPAGTIRGVHLIPADSLALRERWSHILATELGLLTPALRLVRVRSCDVDLGPHLELERIDDRFLLRHGLRGVTLVKMGMDPMRPDRQFPVIDADSTEQVKLRGLIVRAMAEVAAGRTAMLTRIMDPDAVAAWALMAWMDQRDLRSATVTFAYDRIAGHFRPIHQVALATEPEAEGNELLYNMITPLLELPEVRSRFMELQERIASNWSAWHQREAATDNLWRSLLGVPDRALHTVERATDPGALDHFKWTMRAGPGHATLAHGIPLPPAEVTSPSDTVELARLAQRYDLILQGDSILFPRGKYTIEEDLEFPAGHTVVMQQGARLFLAPGRSILVKGDLHIRGTLRNPVFIRPLEEGVGFGTIALLGNGTQQCAISGLYISGGTGAKLAGMHCEGMVTILAAARTAITSSVLQESTAEASLVVDGGELRMDEVRWEDGARHFARLDQVRAVVRDPVMIGARTNATTGLWLRSGTVAVLGGTFTAMRGEAIRAEGSAQALVRHARLSRNATALYSGGQAEVLVEGCTIDANEVAFAPATGSPGDRFIRYPNTMLENGKEHTSASGIKDASALDAATVSRFGVPLTEAPPPAPRRRGGVTRQAD